MRSGIRDLGSARLERETTHALMPMAEPAAIRIRQALCDLQRQRSERDLEASRGCHQRGQRKKDRDQGVEQGRIPRSGGHMDRRQFIISSALWPVRPLPVRERLAQQPAAPAAPPVTRFEELRRGVGMFIGTGRHDRLSRQRRRRRRRRQPVHEHGDDLRRGPEGARAEGHCRCCSTRTITATTPAATRRSRARQASSATTTAWRRTRR